jgi:hypothetical protein
MPSREVHLLLDKLVLGKGYPRVHKTLDLPSLWMGARHRSLMHDVLTAMFVGLLVGNSEGAMSALMHVWLDKQLSPYIRRKK